MPAPIINPLALSPLLLSHSIFTLQDVKHSWKIQPTKIDYQNNRRILNIEQGTSNYEMDPCLRRNDKNAAHPFDYTQGR